MPWRGYFFCLGLGILAATAMPARAFAICAPMLAAAGGGELKDLGLSDPHNLSIVFNDVHVYAVTGNIRYDASIFVPSVARWSHAIDKGVVIKISLSSQTSDRLRTRLVRGRLWCSTCVSGLFKTLAKEKITIGGPQNLRLRDSWYPVDSLEKILKYGLYLDGQELAFEVIAHGEARNPELFVRKFLRERHQLRLEMFLLGRSTALLSPFFFPIALFQRIIGRLQIYKKTRAKMPESTPDLALDLSP